MTCFLKAIVACKNGRNNAPHYFQVLFNSGLHKWTMRLELVTLLSIRNGDLLLLSVMKLCYSHLATTSDLKLPTGRGRNLQGIDKVR